MTTIQLSEREVIARIKNNISAAKKELEINPTEENEWKLSDLRYALWLAEGMPKIPS
jgi:hypothetical protein